MEDQVIDGFKLLRFNFNPKISDRLEKRPA